MIFIAASVVLAWFLSSPISFYNTVEDTKLAFNSVDTVESQGIEALEYDGCKEAKEACQCVALIHGMGDSAYTWTQTLTAEAATWEKPIYFYAINLPGSSDSKPLEKQEDYKVSAIANRLLANLPTRCEKWTLVGNSFGGWISIKMASLQPEKVQGLLLLGSAGIEADYSSAVKLFEAPTIENLREFQQKAYAKPKKIPEFIFSNLSKRLEKMPVKQMIQAQTKEEFIDADFKSLTTPTLLVWGEKDQVCPLTLANKMKELNPKANLEIIKDCGHLPQKECFKDFAKNLNTLLKVEVADVNSATNVK